MQNKPVLKMSLSDQVHNYIKNLFLSYCSHHIRIKKVKPNDLWTL